MRYHGDALVAGASGGIGAALVVAFLTDPTIERVFAVSRSQTPPIALRSHPRLVWLCCDYSEASMLQVRDQIQALRPTLLRVALCHGVLHGEHLAPEKRLEDLDAVALQTVFAANAIVPVLWLKVLRKLLSHAQHCKVAVLSARVGSIGDNHLGGWYAYRASKAALNMLLKTAAIEYSRRSENVKLLSFHPGTTDTPLSKPFQSSVAADKLFTPDFVAAQLIALMTAADIDGQLAFIDWNGQSIDW